MKNKRAIIMALALGFCGIAKAQVNGIVSVQSGDLWTDTGIVVTNGEWININSQGYWSWGGDWNGPDGAIDLPDIADTFLQNGLHGSLIAYVGSDPFQGHWGNTNNYYGNNTNYWEIGTARQFHYVGPTNGELWLGFNDDAVSKNVGDNAGSVDATVFAGFNTNGASDPSFTVAVSSVSSNSFSFTISNGIPNSVASIFDSSDMMHWTLLDSVVLDGDGGLHYATDTLPPSSDSGLNNGVFSNHTAVPYRFYKVANGQYWSKPIGFVRLTIPVNYTNWVANQLDNVFGNTLDGIFNIGAGHTMIDGTTLPAGTEVWKWNGSGYNISTWNGSSWSPSGGTTLEPGGPGGGAAMVNRTNGFIVTFAGTVREGELRIPIDPARGTEVYSSIVPQAGGIMSVLKYNPVLFDQFMIPRNGNYWDLVTCYYDPISLDPGGSPTGWSDGGGPVDEPVVEVGQPFFIIPADTNNWVRYFNVHLKDE